MLNDPAANPEHADAGAITGWQTNWGYFVKTFYYEIDHQRVIVLQHGEPSVDAAPLIRIHSACLTGESLGSTRCDCREQLDVAMEMIKLEGAGLLLYFLDHEGRGIGLHDKLLAYGLQDEGHDTTAANVILGHPVDGRDYSPAVTILKRMGFDKARLLTNNPRKIEALENGGIEVDRVPLWVEAGPAAEGYLTHKRSFMEHLA